MRSKTSNKVSAIVPVYNEEKTLDKVITTLITHPLINEVIAINDGSTDNSWPLLQEFKDRVVLINFKKNHGKGYVLATGIKKAKNPIVFFCDADLVNLDHRHIDQVIMPLLQNKAEAILGYPNSVNLYPIFANLTGERAYRKADLVPLIKEMKTTRFGVEVFLNKKFKNRQVLKIPLHNLRGLYKYEKQSTITATKEYIKAFLEISKEIIKTEKILPEDISLLAKMRQVSSLKELKTYMKLLQNKKLRQLLNSYFHYLSRR